VSPNVALLPRSRAPIMRSAAFLFAFSVVACLSPTKPSGPPGVTGAIVARDLSISIGGPPTIHVKELPTTECGVVFLVRQSTRIVRRVDGTLQSAAPSELTVGRRVAVWADVVLRSCPGQSTAAVVEIMD
jgi:hypothetical protein